MPLQENGNGSGVPRVAPPELSQEQLARLRASLGPAEPVAELPLPTPPLAPPELNEEQRAQFRVHVAPPDLSEANLERLRNLP